VRAILQPAIALEKTNIRPTRGCSTDRGLPRRTLLKLHARQTTAGKTIFGRYDERGNRWRRVRCIPSRAAPSLVASSLRRLVVL